MKSTTQSRAVWALLAGLLAVLLLLPLTATALPANQLNYGKNDPTDQTMSPSALFDALFAEELPLTSVERAALDALSDVAFRYNQSIPDSVIKREYNGNTGVLTVLVSRYSFTAANGKTVTWVPTSLSMDGGTPVELTDADGDGVYTCSFSELWNSDELRLAVDFAWQVEIPQATADGLLTMPYTVGQETLRQLESYAADKQAHDAADAAHRAYLAAMELYTAEKTNFDTYTGELKRYNERKAAYDSYILALAAYEAELEAYRQNEAKEAAWRETEKKYFAYQNFLKENAAFMDSYDRYNKELEGALSRLSIMNSMFIADSNGWQFYSGVMGPTVDSVLANKDLISGYTGVKEEYINLAYDATRRLRPLLSGYAEIYNREYESELERYRAEFAYYQANYEDIRDQLNLLYDSLYVIYSNAGLRAAMNVHPDTKEKVPHFRQFLGQMYVLSCALDNSRNLEADTWTVAKDFYDFTLRGLVEPELLIADTNKATPDGVTLPDKEVKIPEDMVIPERIEQLPPKDFDETLENPADKGAPAEVKDPGDPPAKVEDPGDPPAYVAPAGAPPTEPSFTSAERALANAYKNGSLPQRIAKNTPQQLTLQQTVTCVRYITNRKTVTFYDMDGSKLEEVSVEYGERVIGPNMSRPSDEKNSYVFLGWVPFGSNDPADRVSLQSVKEDLSLSPLYQITPHRYEITWRINGESYTTYCEWGVMPTCPYSTDRADTDTMTYAFVGWSPEVKPVTGAAFYTAQYDERVKTFTVTWIVGDRTENQECPINSEPICPIPTERQPDGSVYCFQGWNQQLRPVTQNITYRAKYEVTKLGEYSNGETCGAIHTEDAVRLLCEQATVNFAGASSYARSQGKLLILQWGDFSVKLTEELLTALDAALCTRIEWRTVAGELPGEQYFAFRYLNRIGQEIALGRELPISIAYTPVGGMTAMTYLVGEKTLTKLEPARFADGRAELSLAAGVQMLFRPEYQLKFSDPTANSSIASFPSHAPQGSTVSLLTNCTFGYEVTGAILTLADGTKETLNATSFLMPANALAIELRVERIVYHVSFVSDGKVISQLELFFDQQIPLPDDPTKAEDESYTYRFTGWTPYVSRTTGEDRNPVYTATFERIPKQVTVVTPGKDGFLYGVLPVASAIVLVTVVAILLLVHFRHQIISKLQELVGVKKAASADPKAKKRATEEPQPSELTEELPEAEVSPASPNTTVEDPSVSAENEGSADETTSSEREPEQ